jgi:RNA polymerase sigma-70 factor (ECF subfamily)
MNSVDPRLDEEQQLVRRFISGDLQAFEVLYGVYAQEVLLFLAARVDNHADAEDLLHDAWITAKDKPGNFDGKNFRAWFFQVARNKLYDFSKSMRAGKRPFDLSAEHEIGGDNDNPSAQISRDEELIALQDCMNSVGGEFVEAVRRNKVDGESPEDIANDLGLDVATIYSRIFRGKKKLQACLETKLK